MNKSASGMTSVELNREANSDSFNKYYAGDEVQIFTGTDKEQSQMDELVKRFQSFLEA